MPIIDPLQFPKFDASLALREAGLLKQDPKDLINSLEIAGLSQVEVLDTVGNIMRTGETSQNRLKAAEMGLKLLGLMNNRDESSNRPIVTIVIKDAQHTEVNPILIPR